MNDISEPSLSSPTLIKVLNTLQIRRDYSQQPAGLRWRSNTFFITATIAIGLFSDLLLYSLVIPVIPFMLRDRVGVPDDQVQSYVSGLLAAYAAPSVIFSPFAGILSDRMPTRQAPFLLCLLTLFAATLMLFLGTTIPVLFLARILQGISASVVWTVGLALCLETVGPENMGKTIGSIFSFLSVSALCGPIIGGPLYEKGGNMSVCAVGLAMLGVDFLMRAIVIEKKVARSYGLKDAKDSDQSEETPEDERNDNGDEEDITNEGQPLLGKRDAGDDDEDFKLPQQTWKVYRLFPVLPCLRNARLATALFTAFVQAALLGSIDATVPVVGKELFGFSSLEAGLLFLPLCGTDLLLGPVLGWCVDRFGPKPVAVCSFALTGPVFILLRLPHAGGRDQVILYGGILALVGISLAGTGSPGIVEAAAVMERFYKVNPDHFGKNGPYAQLYGISNMAFSLGLAVGPELAGELKRVIGYGNMNAVLAAMSVVTAVVCFFYMGRKPRQKRSAP